MNDKEIRDYLKTIAESEIELTGVEENVAKKFRETGNKFKTLVEDMQKHGENFNKAKEELAKATAQMDVYTDVLVSAERKRRDAVLNKTG